MDGDSERLFLRGGFDASAEDYDRTRPVCPPELFDDLVGSLGLSAGARVVEIGCGTGQATVPLAERGLDVTAIELGAELAAVARRRLAGFPNVEVLNSAFEDWQPPAESFDVVAAFNSLHWIDPELRYAKPATLVTSGGAMVVGHCRWARPEGTDPFWFEVQHDYRAVGFEGEPPPTPESIGLWHFPEEATGFFQETAAFRYPFQMSYSTDDYLAILATQSGTRLLSVEKQAEFLERVHARLANTPRLTATFVALLTIGKKIG